MINIIIIDDEPHCIKAVKNILPALPFKVNILAECNSADQASEAITKLHPDLIFLDVEMPGKNGFDLLNELTIIDFDIIFITAYEHYAIDAIRSSALDFLLKPVTEKSLMEALHRYESKKYKENMLGQVRILLQNYGRDNEKDKMIVVPTDNSLEFIHVNKIIRLEAQSNYTTFLLSDNSKLLVAKTLKELEELLPQKIFYRVHHSHLINIGHIKRFEKSDGGRLIMEDKTSVPVSRLRKKELLDFLRNR